MLDEEGSGRGVEEATEEVVLDGGGAAPGNRHWVEEEAQEEEDASSENRMQSLDGYAMQWIAWVDCACF